MSERVTLVVHHFVEDFDAWKPVFDGHEDVRRSHGALEHRLYQDPSNRSRLVVHNDFPSAEGAASFAKDPSLPEAMERGGVTGEPFLSYATLAELKRYVDGEAGVTFVVHHPVRDYDAWKPVFDEHETVRRQHGAIEHRVWRIVRDPNLIAVHLDFPSESDGEGFVADPTLKDAMERAGVTAEPGIGRLALIERKVYGCPTPPAGPAARTRPCRRGRRAARDRPAMRPPSSRARRPARAQSAAAVTSSPASRPSPRATRRSRPGTTRRRARR